MGDGILTDLFGTGIDCSRGGAVLLRFRTRGLPVFTIGNLLVDLPHVSGEVNIRLLEFGAGPGFESETLGGTHLERGDIFFSLRLLVGTPLEAFKRTVGLGHLRHRPGVVLGRFVVIYLLQVSVRECGGEHLGVHFVGSSEFVVLLEEEHRVGTAEGVETAQRRGAVEIRHHLRGAYLVEEGFGFLRRDEGVGHETRPFRAASLYQDEEAVRGVLAVAVVPDNGVEVEACDGIEVVVAKRVAAHLEVVAIDLNIARGIEETEFRRVGRCYFGQAVGNGRRVRRGRHGCGIERCRRQAAVGCCSKGR